ncbi:hypothetical protein D9M69_724140 [compost metagenome]
MLDRTLDTVAVLRVLVLDDHHRHTIYDEHHVCTVALARGWLNLPLPRYVEHVVRHVFEVDDGHRPVALLSFVVPLALAAEPGQ